MPDQLNTTIPQGPDYDSFNLQIIIKIIDNFGGKLEFLIPTLIKVLPNNFLSENSTIIDEIINYDSKSNLNIKLNEGDLQDSSKILLSISTMLNSECNKDKNSLIVSRSILISN